jgi:hypothetical protein
MNILFLLLVVELIVIASLCVTSKQASNLQYYRKIKHINEFKLFMRYEQVFVLDLILL